MRVATVTEKEKRTDVSVKIDAGIQRKAKMIAAYRDITIAEYLSQLLEGPVNEDYKQLHKDMKDEE